MARYSCLPIRITLAEADAILPFAIAALRASPSNVELQSAVGKLLGGDDASAGELRSVIGSRWYVSPTGRKLKSRLDDETPITPRKLAEIELTLIRRRALAAITA